MAAQLPKFHTQITELSLLQSQWPTLINPLLSNPSLNSTLLKDIVLAIGNNTINHMLGRTPQGWRIADINAVSSIYRSAAFNNQTITLNSSAVATISLEVF